jgi:hypothetical protein
MDIILWAMLKITLYVPLLPAELNDLKHEIWQANVPVQQETL